MILRAYLKLVVTLTIAFLLVAVLVVLTATVIQVGGLTVRVTTLEGHDK